MKKLYLIIISLISFVYLSACGGSSSTDPASITPAKGFLTLGVTDAPVDDAARVVVEFDGVIVAREGAEDLTFTFEARQIDLLSLQGGGSELLLDGVELEAGVYQSIRLLVNAERNTMDSYVELPDTNQISLFVPSGAQSGLKLNDSFTVLAGGSSNLTIDFDLRKSLVDPRGQSDYFLKPRLRLIDNSESGEIMGTVDEALITAEDCSDVASVYVFPADVTIDGIDDIDIAEEGEEDIGGADPLVTATVSMNDEGIYTYMAAFIPSGDYVLGLTCQADLDQMDIDNTLTDENMPDQVVDFTAAAEISVATNAVTEYNFVVESNE